MRNTRQGPSDAPAARPRGRQTIIVIQKLRAGKKRYADALGRWNREVSVRRAAGVWGGAAAYAALFFRFGFTTRPL